MICQASKYVTYTHHHLQDPSLVATKPNPKEQMNKVDSPGCMTGVEMEALGTATAALTMVHRSVTRQLFVQAL